MYRLVFVAACDQKANPQPVPSRFESTGISGESHGITGLHIYRDGSIFGVIEGESKESAVAFYHRLLKDNNYIEECVLSEGMIDGREFNDWFCSYEPRDNDEMFSKVRSKYDADGSVRILLQLVREHRA